MIILVICGVLFPIWPYELKYAAWLVSFYILIFLLSVILGRLVLYVILAQFGISFWLFPNLLGDKGVIDSFKPLISIEKWENDSMSIIGRLIAFSIFMYYAVSIYRDPDFYLCKICIYYRKLVINQKSNG